MADAKAFNAQTADCHNRALLGSENVIHRDFNSRGKNRNEGPLLVER